jgi:hypothetical protein
MRTDDSISSVVEVRYKQHERRTKVGFSKGKASKEEMST